MSNWKGKWHISFSQVLDHARAADLLSKEHFSVDGTLIEALASLKSYRPKDEDEPPTVGGGRNPTVDFRGDKRSRDTHESKTDPDALLYRKSKGTTAELSYMGHLLMENRHGLVVNACVTQATGKAEREAVVEMLEALNVTHRVTVGADKNYDTKGFVKEMRELNATPLMWPPALWMMASSPTNSNSRGMRAPGCARYERGGHGAQWLTLGHALAFGICLLVRLVNWQVTIRT